MRLGGADLDWERGIMEADVPPAPVRHIAVTPEMRAQDAAQRAAREAESASDWSIKSSLREENLHAVRRNVAPGRQRARREIALPAPAIRRKKVIQSVTKEKRGTAAKPKEKEEKRVMGGVRRFREVTAGAPRPIEEVLRLERQRGHESPYRDLFQRILALPAGSALPVSVQDLKHGWSVDQALKKLAKLKGIKLERRREPDGKTFYFWISAAGAKGTK